MVGRLRAGAPTAPTAHEGLGGLAAGGSLLAGCPGAALLYGGGARHVPVPRAAGRGGGRSRGGCRRAWSRATWLAPWIGAAFFSAMPQAGNGINSMPFMLTINEKAPRALHAVDAAEQSWLTVGNTNLADFAVSGLASAWSSGRLHTPRAGRARDPGSGGGGLLLCGLHGRGSVPGTPPGAGVQPGGACRPARVTATSRRAAAGDGRVPAAPSACRQ